MGKAYEPWSPPLVEMATGGIGHLLEWRLHERNGEWWAWVSWVQTAGDRPKHMVVEVRAVSLRPIEAPEVYAGVPRRMLGRDGRTRPWAPGAAGRRGLGCRWRRARLATRSCRQREGRAAVALLRELAMAAGPWRAGRGSS